jgi:hypothetical protein
MWRQQIGRREVVAPPPESQPARALVLGEEWPAGALRDYMTGLVI